MGFLVENPGVLTTVQDEGRYGYERFGMSPSGPMDSRAFHIANILVGNPWGESALEVTVLGPSLRFDGDAIIALTGANMSPRLNGAPCPMYRALTVKAGDLLQLGAARQGCRGYIAVSGGLDVPLVMGSRSTALKNRVGGFQGRKLEKGDHLSFRSPAKPPVHPELRAAPIPAPQEKEVLIRVIPGPQDDAFTREGLECFFSRPYTVSRDSDRMGCRLEGPVIAHKTDGNIISDGIVAGSIQVPTSGQPIIMLAERQTTGGYTKIATVITVDLPIVGQCKAGDTIRFQAVTVPEAHRLLREQDKELRALQARLDSPSCPASPSFYRITVNGKVYELSVQRV